MAGSSTGSIQAVAIEKTPIHADEATARAWAAVENTAREDLHPADEIRAFGRMRETVFLYSIFRSVAQPAMAYGLSLAGAGLVA